MRLQGRAANPAPSWRVSSLPAYLCNFAWPLRVCCKVVDIRGRRGSAFSVAQETHQPVRSPGCTIGARLPVSHPDSLSVSVIFDQSCRRSQRMWWTDASLSPWCQCLCSVRSLTKKLTGRYWFSLFRDSLYTRRPKWRHSPVFWHVLRVCILELQPAQRNFHLNKWGNEG